MTAAVSSWQTPPADLRLGPGEVHVWRAYLNEPAVGIQELWQTLSADERERAGRFHFRRDRDSFVIARGTLRAIAGGYLNVRPGQLRFRYGRHGKPALAGGFADGPLSFNLSYSHRMALYALARDREVGVDLEYIRGDLASREIAGHFFSPQEVSRLNAQPAHLWQAAFFNCWTRKEAYVKARGEGLSLALKQFEVSPAPGEKAAIVNSADPEETLRWSLVDLSPGEGYAASLAFEGQDARVGCWQWGRPEGVD